MNIASPTEERSPSPPQQQRSRQKPGSACEECRRRKLRCDRQRPQCGVCMEMGVECTIDPARPSRGPKKGHMKALRTRIGKYIKPATMFPLLTQSAAALERRLVEQQDPLNPSDQISDLVERPTSSAEGAEDVLSRAQPPVLPSVPSANSISDSDWRGKGKMTPELMGGSTNAAITELMRADLYVLRRCLI